MMQRLFLFSLLLLHVIACKTSKDGNSLTVHRVKSGIGSFYSNAHILEGANSLVVVDAQMDKADVLKLIRAIKILDKPLEAIIITHRHPDHLNGLKYLASAFKDSPIKAGIKTSEAIKLNVSEWGIDESRIQVLNPGNTVLVGTKFEISIYNHSESPESLVLYEPNSQSLLTGDLVLNQQHPWLAEKEMENWVQNLRDLKTRFPKATVNPGHGVKGDIGLCDNVLNYINDFKEVLGAGHPYQKAQQKMLEKYPTHAFPTALDYSLRAYGLLPDLE